MPSFATSSCWRGWRRFGAEAADAFVGVVAGESGQVHAGDGAEKPGGLVIFFYGAAGDEGLGAALDGAGVDANVFDPVEIQRDAAIGLQGAIAQMSEGSVRRRERRF